MPFPILLQEREGGEEGRKGKGKEKEEGGERKLILSITSSNQVGFGRSWSCWIRMSSGYTLVASEFDLQHDWGTYGPLQ